ncbi:MAG TPA: hypothetical protein VIZ86_16445 [Pseudomonas sp.]
MTEFKPFGTEALSSALAWATIVGQAKLSDTARLFADHCSPRTALDAGAYRVTAGMKFGALESVEAGQEIGAALALALEPDVKLEIVHGEPIAFSPFALNATMQGMTRLLLDGQEQIETLPGGWVPVDKVPAPRGERLLVLRTTDGSPIGNPDHPGYKGCAWVEISTIAGIGGRFFCDFLSAGRVTHWMPLPPAAPM